MTKKLAIMLLLSICVFTFSPIATYAAESIDTENVDEYLMNYITIKYRL